MGLYKHDVNHQNAIVCMPRSPAYMQPSLNEKKMLFLTSMATLLRAVMGLPLWVTFTGRDCTFRGSYMPVMEPNILTHHKNQSGMQTAMPVVKTNMCQSLQHLAAHPTVTLDNHHALSAICATFHVPLTMANINVPYTHVCM